MFGTAVTDGVPTGLRQFLRQPSVGSTLAWAAFSISALLPWVIGAGVKIYLDSQGRPTWDWLHFLHPTFILYELWATLWFALPGIGVALLCYLMFTDRIVFFHRFNSKEKAVIVLISLLVGALGSVPTFIDIYREFHPIVLMLPFFVTILYARYYVAGLLLGLALAELGYRIRSGANRRSGLTIHGTDSDP